MWYFTWVLGLGFACAFGIINALWIEFRESNEEDKDGSPASKKAVKARTTRRTPLKAPKVEEVDSIPS